MELKREIRKGMGVGMVLNKFKDTGQNFVFFFSPESLSFSVAHPDTSLRFQFSVGFLFPFSFQLAGFLAFLCFRDF